VHRSCAEAEPDEFAADDIRPTDSHGNADSDTGRARAAGWDADHAGIWIRGTVVDGATAERIDADQ
jgi:hypothetical protein